MKKVTGMMIGFVVITVLLFGCASSVPETTTMPANDEIIKNAPDWFTNPPSDPNYYFGTGTGTSRDMQVARDKATQNAMMQISLDMEKKFEGLRKTFQEEIGTAVESQYLEQFTQSSKAVTSQVMTGANMDKSEFRNEGGVFRSYVLYSLSVGASLQDLNNRLSQQEELYTRFRSTQAFEEMEKEIEKYEQFKQQQGR